MEDILSRAEQDGIYAICIHDDTSSYEVYYIPASNITVDREKGLVKSRCHVFSLNDYNKTWSLYRETLE